MSEPSFGEQREPTLSTAVEMQLTDASARLAEPTVPAPRLVLGHQAGGLQGVFHEGVAGAHPMLAPGELAEMADVEAQIVLAIERAETLHV
jgi:hypothetical protein